MYRGLLLLLLGVMIPGCGGVDWFPAIGPDSSASITLTSSSNSPMVNASVTITATVKKADDSAVPDGTVVSFSANGGTLSGFSAATRGGTASVTFTSASAGDFRVMASTGIISNSLTVTFQPTITVTASPTSVSIFNVFSTPVTVTATVKNADGSPAADGTAVTFSAPGAFSISPVTATTTDGVATTTVTLPNFSTTISVTAASGSMTSAPVVISVF